jgi:hypothetical protein
MLATEVYYVPAREGEREREREIENFSKNLYPRFYVQSSISENLFPEIYV